MFKLIIFMAIAIHILNVPDVWAFYAVIGFFWLLLMSFSALLGGAISSTTK